MPFMEAKTSLSCSQEPATCPYPEPDPSTIKKNHIFTDL